MLAQTIKEDMSLGQSISGTGETHQATFVDQGKGVDPRNAAVL